MAGKKPSTTKSSKTTVLSGQHDLFHFYQKQPRLRGGGGVTATSGKEATASMSSGVRALLKEDTATQVSISETSRQPSIPEVNGAVSGGATSVGVHPGSQRLSPCIDPPLRGKEMTDRESAKTSEDPAPHPSQAVIAVDADKRSVPQVSEAQRIGSFDSRQKSYAETVLQEPFEKSRGSPVGDDRTSIVQDRSSSSSRKHLTNASDDLTASRGDGSATNANTTSREQRHVEFVANIVPSGSQGAPIDLISSPEGAVRVLHPFFARQVKKQKDTSALHLTTSDSRPMQAPWPGAEDQHSTGPQTRFSPGSSWFGRYRKTPAPVAFPSPSGLRWLNAEAPPPLLTEPRVESHIATPLEHEAVISSLPNAHREHPGISRLLVEPPRVLKDGEMWTQRWKPRRAAEVLGNEDNALYLKAWLQALTLGGRIKSTTAGERPMVVRAVAKKRGRKRRRVDSDEEWLVDDGEGESGSDDDWTSPRAMAGVQRHPGVIGDPSSSAADNESSFPEFSTLTNTILLAGPPGSGKSSTIYACAEELGWEVFEVYPGIGKRSGGGLSSLIGDVGKNHHVGKRGASNKRSSHPGIRQSVILLDEVDVLFKEDGNFWPTVVNIIKFSHRPIFMTCNDASLIPQVDLPLQTCLHFKACPGPLAVSFLQCVCLVEGHVVPREQVEMMYDQTYTPVSCDEPEIPSVPYPSQQPPSPDLRQALNNLQFWCAEGTRPGIIATEILADWARSPEGGYSAGEGDLYRLERHAESASYIDGYLERRAWDVLEALAGDRYGPCGDDEIGHTLLDKPAWNSKGLAFYNRDAEMAETALDVTRHVLERSGAGARARALGSTREMDTRSLRRARVVKQTLAVSFLDDVMTVSSPLLPRAAAVLEYTAYVRQMILADDVLAGAGTGQRRGRRTQTRYITVSGEGLEAARSMSLDA